MKASDPSTDMPIRAQMTILGEAVLGHSQHSQSASIAFDSFRSASCHARPAAGAQVHSQHSKVPLVAREDYAEPRMVQSLKPLPNRKELGKTFKQLGKARRRHLQTLRPHPCFPPSSCLRAFKDDS